MLNDIEVAGTFYQLKAAIAFCRSDPESVSIQPEPSNKHDRNAVKVIGHHVNSKGKRSSWHIGYVPAEHASRVFHHADRDNLLIRLGSIWVTADNDQCIVRFDVLEPTK